MAGRNAAQPQVIDDKFVDDMVRDLKVVGSMGVLNVGDGILPVYLLGQRTAFNLETSVPFYKQSEIFAPGLVTNPFAATVIVATGVLPVGIFDLVFRLGHTVATPTAWNIKRFDGAGVFVDDNLMSEEAVEFRISLEHDDPTEYRINMAVSVTGFVTGQIFAKLRG